MSTIHTPIDVQLRRVRALLAKANATPFEEEAEAYIDKAQQLMTRYAIDAAMLRETGVDHDEIVTRRILVERPYALPRTRLLGAAARANHARLILGDREVDGRACYLVGHGSDLDRAIELFACLTLQATRSMLTASTDGDTRAFRHAFLLAYAERIGRRLRAATAEQEASEEHRRGPSVALAVVHRHDAVDRAVAVQFPHLTPVRTTASSRRGLRSGASAADRAALGGRAFASSPRQLPSGLVR